MTNQVRLSHNQSRASQQVLNHRMTESRRISFDPKTTNPGQKEGTDGDASWSTVASRQQQGGTGDDIRWQLYDIALKITTGNLALDAVKKAIPAVCSALVGKTGKAYIKDFETGSATRSKHFKQLDVHEIFHHLQISDKDMENFSRVAGAKGIKTSVTVCIGTTKNLTSEFIRKAGTVLFNVTAAKEDQPSIHFNLKGRQLLNDAPALVIMKSPLVERSPEQLCAEIKEAIISAATIIGVDKRGLSQPKAREQAINKWGDVRIESETGYIEVTGLNTFKLGSDIVTNYGYSTQCKMVYKFFTEKEVAEELQAMVQTIQQTCRLTFGRRARIPSLPTEPVSAAAVLQLTEELNNHIHYTAAITTKNLSKPISAETLAAPQLLRLRTKNGCPSETHFLSLNMVLKGFTIPSMKGSSLPRYLIQSVHAGPAGGLPTRSSM